MSASRGIVRAPQGARTAQGLIAASAVLYGTQGIFASVAYDHGASVGILVALRALLFLVLAAFLLDRARRATLRGHRRTIAIACAASVIGPTLFFAAVSRTDPATVTLVTFVYPALTLIGARLLGRVRMTPQALLVTLVALVGVVLAVGAPAGDVDPIGVLLALAGAVTISSYFLAAEHGLEGVDPLAWLGISVLVAAVFLVPLAPLIGGVALPDAGGWLAIVAVAVVASIIPSLLQTTGLMRLGSAATSLVATLEIATVVLLSVVVLGERPTPLGLLGAVLVIVGAAAAPLVVQRTARTRPSR